MTTGQIIALSFPLVMAGAGAAALVVRRFRLRTPELKPIDPAQIDIAVAMANIREAMKEIERANGVVRQKSGR